MLAQSGGPGGAPGSSEQGNFALGRAIVEHWTSHARQAMVVRFLVPFVPVTEPDLGCGDPLLGGELS
jgi:hypothetical protein